MLFSTHLSCSARQKALTVSTPKLETQMHLHRKSVYKVLPRNKAHATIMQPLQYILQHHPHIQAATTMRLASTWCRTPRENRLRLETSAPATAAHPRSAAASAHGKTKGFVLWLFPKTKPMQQSCSRRNAFCSTT